MINKLPDTLTNSELFWIPSKGIGFHTAPPIEYSKDYFEYYKAIDDSLMAEALNDFRANIAEEYFPFETFCVDVGIGGGRFLEEISSRGLIFFGYDINKYAVDYLKYKSRWVDLYDGFSIDNATMWDVFEHVPDHRALLKPILGRVIMSIPIFEDLDHVLRSKHYKPGEHIWYFTEYGLIEYMKTFGFKLLKIYDNESKLGREDILTFVFERD